jgi:HK97 gp10 family phage protein
MANNNIVIIDNSGEVSAGIKAAIKRALIRIGMQAESFAKKLCVVDTGRLRNSITWKVKDDAAYIGTNVEYAPYVELGTGKYYPGGRQTPWVYKDDKGNWHMTHGQRARPFLKPAATEHAQTYRNIVEDELRNG